MKICHVCKAECEDYTELCPICGADLTTESAVEDDASQQEEVIVLKNPVLVASVEDVVSSEIFKDILHENGIIFTCDEPDSEGTLKVVFGGSFVADDIYVDETDLEKASQLYQDFLNSEPEFDDEFFENEEEAEYDGNISAEDVDI